MFHQSSEVILLNAIMWSIILGKRNFQLLVQSGIQQQFNGMFFVTACRSIRTPACVVSVRNFLSDFFVACIQSSLLNAKFYAYFTVTIRYQDYVGAFLSHLVYLLEIVFCKTYWFEASAEICVEFLYNTVL